MESKRFAEREFKVCLDNGFTLEQELENEGETRSYEKKKLGTIRLYNMYSVICSGKEEEEENTA